MGLLNIPISFEQLVQAINRLPLKQRLKLSQELERDFVERRLSNLLATFKTDELTDEVIDRESEAVRKQLYASRKKHPSHR